MDKTFEKINSKAAGNVNSLISVTISTDATVIWYDHWEDGFEVDVTNPEKSTTQIWGDGDASNGCAPNVSDCTDAKDVLKAGDAIVMENDVQLPRKQFDKRYDGGDRIQSSFPIAVTRGAYPDTPGSLMAGAVEVLDTGHWGYAFQAPVGAYTWSYTSAFELVQLYIMAAEVDTKVTLPNGTIETIGMGESITVSVKQGDLVTSDKLVQVDLVSGDKGSNYQLRWYSLRATADWSTSYIAPMGDTTGQTAVVLYNPNDTPLDITCQYRDLGDGNKLKSYTKTLAGGTSTFSKIIRDGSAAKFTANKNFIGLSLTDNKGGGQLYDWVSARRGDLEARLAHSSL